MRIIGGKLKGQRISLPKNLPARPTTDFGREGLFNVLVHNYPQHKGTILELFSGSGFVALEFLSRGAKHVVSVEKHPVCVNHLRKTARAYSPQWEIVKREVFYFLDTCMDSYDVIFADPPYDLPNLTALPEKVFAHSNLLKEKGLLIVEHPKKIDFSEAPNFVMHKKYGNVNFSFFQHQATNEKE